MNIVLPPRFKSIKHGQAVDAYNIHEMELRVPIDENRRPTVPKDLIVNVPKGLLNKIPTETLKRLEDKYVVTHE